MTLTYSDLNDLPLDFSVSANQIAALSGQNQMKGIHPVDHQDFKGVVILCTIEGISYANQWLDPDQSKLKYFLEGRTDRTTGKRTFNPNIKSNKSVMESEFGLPLLVFVRNKSGDKFRYQGKFVFTKLIREIPNDMYFILQKKN